MPAPEPRARPVEILGWLCIWNALYVAAALIIIQRLIGRHPSPRPALAASLIALATYATDRVKLHRIWRDPADEHAHPRRAEFYRVHARPLRIALIIVFLAAAAACWSIHPAAIFLPLGSVTGVILYAGPRIRGARVKDRLILKNAAVAASIIALCLALIGFDALAADAVDALPLAALAAASGIILLQVFTDAVLCDLTDRESDAAHGTRTIPVVRGPRPARWIALALQFVISAAAAAAGFALLTTTPALLFASLTLIGAAILHGVPDRFLRDATDLRLSLVALPLILAHALGGG
ncbi:MAG: UbiA family prenyltransferase [Planctomycetota bacterium]|nr:UbiA family prenyltransferase [Planctomycetota bacterium]